ncbi:response regulator [Aestuariirhabdus litorea]|uniref:histidine kinase n=2 Tax=Aestuariirhabdus litorea TaxID=2528527 RepID=A0A3P3VKK6_9GAMM|nr:response regulator [Aestuariirhabdus litorea]
MRTLHGPMASCLLWLLVLIAPSVFAMVEVPTGSYHINLTRSLDTYLDDSGNLSLEELRSDYYVNRFSPSRLEYLQLGSTDATVWIRIRLNSTQATLTPYLMVTPPDIGELELFQRNQQGWTSTLTGANHPYPTRPIDTRDFIFPLAASDVPQEIYLRLRSARPLNISVHLASADQLIGHEHSAHWFSGVLFGLFLATLIYNLIAWSGFRDRSFIYLSLFMLCGLLFQASWQGLLAELLPQWPRLQSYTYTLSILAGTALGSQLIRRFFSTHETQPLIDQSLRLLVIIPLLASLLVPFLGDRFPVGAALLMGTLSSTLIFASTLYYIRKNFPCAIDLFVAQTPFALAALLNFLAALSLVRIDPQVLEWAIISIASLTMIGESWAFTKHHRRLRRQKTQAVVQDRIRTTSAIAKSELLSKISHSLRGPMNGILGMSELLLESSLTPKQKDYVSTIHNSGNDLLNLLNEVQDISKLETGKMILSDVRFELHPLIDSCLDLYKVTAEQRGIELISYVQLGIPETLNGDPVRLKHVLLAMLAQSFRTIEQGEVLLSVTLVSSSETPRILFTVKDSSNSISEAERSFLLNTRIDTHNFLDSSNTQYSLGLLVSRHVINQMGGTLGIESTPGVGNRYWFTLPYLPIDEAASDTGSFNFSGIRALVVDDNDTCLKVLTQQCLALGMEVSPCLDGKEALALLRTKSHLNSPFDLVILDHNMPGMNGMELAAKIKEDPAFSELVIIMLTGISNTPSRIMSRNAGIQRILTKPVANYMLRTTLAEELQNHLPAKPGGEPGSETLLVVTQNSALGQEVQQLARQRQIETSIAISASQALDTLRSGDYRLVLIDCSSRVHDGFEVAQRIRRWQEAQGLSAVPLVAMSEQSNPDFDQQLRLVQINGLLPLPLTSAQLDKQLDHWLS